MILFDYLYFIKYTTTVLSMCPHWMTHTLHSQAIVCKLKIYLNMFFVFSMYRINNINCTVVKKKKNIF